MPCTAPSRPAPSRECSMSKWPASRDGIVKGGFSTPLDAPTIPRFPFSFRDVEVFTMTYRTDIEAVAALLPEQLAATGDEVMIHLYRMNDTDWLGPYHEVYVMVGAELPGRAVGAYSPYLFLSSEVEVTHGREIHGQPKKLGLPKLEFRGDLIVGMLARNGIDVVTGTMPNKQCKGNIGDLAHIFPFATNLNLKAIDHIDGSPRYSPAHVPQACGPRGDKLLARPLHGRVSAERTGPGAPPARS